MEEKNAVVTGLGEIARSIAINGGQVALVGRSVERLNRTQEHPKKTLSVEKGEFHMIISQEGQSREKRSKSRRIK